MLKGVNKHVVEVVDMENEYFEKAILFLRPGRPGIRPHLKIPPQARSLSLEGGRDHFRGGPVGDPGPGGSRVAAPVVRSRSNGEGEDGTASSPFWQVRRPL